MGDIQVSPKQDSQVVLAPVSKPLYLSKTLWLNLIMAVSAIALPKINEYLKSNPDILVYVVTGVNFVLRLVSKDSLHLWDDKE